MTSKVKAVIKAKNLRSSGEFIEALSRKVHALLATAMEKTVEAKRATVKPEDL